MKDRLKGNFFSTGVKLTGASLLVGCVYACEFVRALFRKLKILEIPSMQRNAVLRLPNASVICFRQQLRIK